MDQHVMQAIKVYHRKELLKKVVESDNDVAQTLKSINLKDVRFCLDDAWQHVSVDLFQKSWKKVWPQNKFEDKDEVPLSILARKIANEKEMPEAQQNLQDIIHLAKKLDETSTQLDLEEWATGVSETCYLKKLLTINLLETLKVNKVLMNAAILSNKERLCQVSTFA